MNPTTSSGSCQQTIHLGLIQSACGPDAEENLAGARAAIQKAAARGARVVCLQELFRSRYFCQREDARLYDGAETIPGPTTEALGDVARSCGVAVITTVFERRAPGIYHNTAVVLGADGTLRARYRKMHIPDDPGYHEKYYFTPGDARDLQEGRDGFVSVELEGTRVGPLVCWDQWFPEAARLTSLLGARILVYPTAIGWLEGERDGPGSAHRESWEIMLRSHAIANGVFVAAINRVGLEEKIDFWGSSLVCDPCGRILGRASTDREEILVVACDLSLVETTRREWPFLRDRRVDAYGGLLERFRGEELER